jgi:predicted PurR-regulated permease PerM
LSEALRLPGFRAPALALRRSSCHHARVSISVRPGGVPTSWLRALLLPLIVLVWLVLAVLFIWVLSHFTRTILILTLATVLAFAFTPLADFFSRWVSRPFAIGLAYLLGLAVIFSFGAYVVATAVAQVATLISNLPGYTQQVQFLQDQLDAIITPLGLPPGWLDDLTTQGLSQIQALAGAVAGDLIPRLAEFFGAIVDVVLMLILSIYLCASGARVANWLKTQTPGPTNSRARALVAITNRVVGGYIRGVVILATLVGFMVGAGMAVLGVPYAVLLGVLAFFMEFIPVLGVFISGAAAVLVALVNFHELLRPAIVLAYFILVHIIEGDVIGPRIMGRAVGIHPATGLIALVAGTEVFGIWGALFAAPLAGLLQAIVVAAWLEFRQLGASGVREGTDEIAKQAEPYAAEPTEEHVRTMSS